MFVVFFFKQKTAYEMRISDWSSDLCSSDLCDVLQADGGTRTAAITGAYVALVDAIRWLDARRELATKGGRSAVVGAVAAVSVGIYRGTPVLDLDYAEDSDCDTDMNVVMNDRSEQRRVGQGRVRTGRSRGVQDSS